MMGQALLALAVLPLVLPAFSLLALTLAALRARAAGPDAALAVPAPGAQAGGAPRVAVLVPAHDESTQMLPTLHGLLAELGAGDRLLVVADNCTDDTAALARAAGAEVVERVDPRRRGKGYALAFGVERLREDPPDVVLVVDADCLLSPGAVALIARDCQDSGRPVQMLNLMQAPEGAGPRLRVLEFAMLVKNLVRPLGSFHLGGACHLMGTGMALPWPLMATAGLATGHLAEDMKLGVALTLAGHPPRFLPGARVNSVFVTDAGVARGQKTRWEHGHLATLREELPGLLGAALRRRSAALAALALDLMIPPLALYLLTLSALLAVTVAGAWFWPGLQAAALLAASGALALGLAVGLAWRTWGRRLLGPRELLALPVYALWKIPVYLGYFLGERPGWTRTRREREARLKAS